MADTVETGCEPLSGVSGVVRSADSGVSPFAHLSPVSGAEISDTRIEISDGQLFADAVYFRIGAGNASPFRFVADTPGLAELCLTASAEFVAVFRSLLRFFPRLFRTASFNLRHLYRREGKLRL